MICGTCGRDHGDSTACPPVVFTPQRVPFTCPVCSGSCKVSRPPWFAGDIPTWPDNGSGTLYPCQACGGTGVVWGPS